MNRKGQAAIESIFLLTLCTLVSVNLIQLGLHFLSEIAVEDLLEQTLICKLQKQSDCVSKLQNKLGEMNYSEVQIIDRSRFQLARIRVEWNATSIYKAALESELHLDLTVR